MASNNPNGLAHETLVAGVSRVIKEVTGLAPEPHADLAAAGVDSMQMLEILAALEDAFGIGVSENMIREFRTIDRIVRIIKDLVGVSER